MCSPELWQGMCCICCGTLTPENTLYDDLNEGRGGVHKGVCAFHAGIVPPEHQVQYDGWMSRMNTCPEMRQEIIREFYKWVSSVADEDHYDMSGPAQEEI